MKLLIHHAGKWMLIAFITVFTLSACEKEVEPPLSRDKVADAPNSNDNGHLKQTKTFQADVVTSWLDLQLDMLRVPLPPGTGTQGADRSQAYCGIALYEAVVGGMPAYKSLCGQLTGLPEMPIAEPGKAYHWAASANAALAEMNRKLFPTTAEVNKTNINILENKLQAMYATEVNDATLQRSIAFGREVAAKVYNWAATDGSANLNDPYIPPTGPGLWVPTAPSPPVNPFAVQRRLLVPGVANGAALDPPIAYSNVPGSPFWNMVKDVYDKSQALTGEQIALAEYYRDVPGYPGGGLYVSVLSQIVKKARPTLDVAALAYAKVGIAQHDVSMVCFIDKYKYSLLRPITYIRNEMGHSTWSPLFATPNHPEYPAAHASNSSAVAEMLADVFGDNFEFTLTTYDYIGLPSRNYNSFRAMALDVGNSRVYGGIHYQPSVDKGNRQGKKVAENVLKKIKFKK